MCLNDSRMQTFDIDIGFHSNKNSYSFFHSFIHSPTHTQIHTQTYIYAYIHRLYLFISVFTLLNIGSTRNFCLCIEVEIDRKLATFFTYTLFIFEQQIWKCGCDDKGYVNYCESAFEIRLHYQ